MFEEYRVPLTFEEQATMLLYFRLRGHIRDTREDHIKTRELIADVLAQFAQTLSRGRVEKTPMDTSYLSERAQEVLANVLYDAIADGTVARVYQKCAKGDDPSYVSEVESELVHLLENMRSE